MRTFSQKKIGRRVATRMDRPGYTEPLKGIQVYELNLLSLIHLVSLSNAQLHGGKAVTPGEENNWLNYHTVGQRGGGDRSQPILMYISNR